MKKDLIILASKSPRRVAIFKQIGINFDSIQSDFKEEKPQEKARLEYVGKLVTDNSRGKAVSVSRKVEQGCIVGVDTLVWCEGKILGKPESEKDALSMLKFLNNKKHYVFSGITIVIKNKQEEKIIFGFDRATVYMRNLLEKEIEKYVETHEPLDKAGAYGIQEKGAVLIKKVYGDYYTIVGFPLALFLEMCRENNIDI